MAFDAFLKIDGIPGESTDSEHKGEIDVITFNWGETRPSVGRGPGPAGGAAAGKVTVQDFHFTKLTDAASPVIFQAVATGQAIKTATLTIREGGDATGASQSAAGQDFLKWNLQNVFVSSYQTGGGIQDDGTYSAIQNGDFDVPVEQFTLSFQKLQLQFTSPTTGAASNASIDTGG